MALLQNLDVVERRAIGLARDVVAGCLGTGDSLVTCAQSSTDP
jgi:hypothetical protein